MKIILCLALSLASLMLDAQPINDLVPRTIQQEKRLLQPQPVREADIFWSKRVWRVIDVREKRNQAFMYPPAPFYEVLKAAILDGQLDAYASEDTEFLRPLTGEALERVFMRRDTVEVFNVETYVPELQVVREEYAYEDIKRFRIEEIWYINSRTSTLNVRILAVSPLRDVLNENGDYLYELPTCRIYFPDARKVLARATVFLDGNDHARYSWDDLFQQRRFSSYVYKDSNVRDERIQDVYSGRDALLAGDRIEAELFNFEQDLCSY